MVGIAWTTRGENLGLLEIVAPRWPQIPLGLLLRVFVPRHLVRRELGSGAQGDVALHRGAAGLTVQYITD